MVFPSEVSCRLPGAGKETSLSLLRNLHSSCPLRSLPCFWKGSLALPTDFAARRWDVGACLSQQCPSVSRAVGAKQRRSPAPSSARRAPGAGGRKDLVWERGKAAREPGLVTSLSEQAQKQRRTRGGARGLDPGERPPGQKRLSRVQSRCLEQPELVPPLPGKAEQGNWTRFFPGRVRGARFPRARALNSGRFAHGAVWGSASAVRGTEGPAGDVPR